MTTPYLNHNQYMVAILARGNLNIVSNLTFDAEHSCFAGEFKNAKTSLELAKISLDKAIESVDILIKSKQPSTPSQPDSENL